MKLEHTIQRASKDTGGIIGEQRKDTGGIIGEQRKRFLLPSGISFFMKHI